MKLARATADPIDIRLNETLTTGAGGVGDRGGLRLMLVTDQGAIGLGETAPIPAVTGPGIESLAAEIEAWSEQVEGAEVESALGELDSHKLGPLARFAVHTALVDLVSSAASVPLSEYLRSGSTAQVKVNALVSESNPGAVHDRVSELVREGVRAIKLKVGASSITEDVTRIIAASEAGGTDVELRLDANRVWDAPTAEKVIGRVGKHRISYIEDPTETLEEFQSIAEATGVPVALDISPSTTAAEQIDRAGVELVIAKPAAVGGVDRIMDIARSNRDLTLIVSTSIDREIALAAAIHAAAAVPGEARAHGLATGSLVRNTPKELLAHDGMINVPRGPGVYRPPATD